MIIVGNKILKNLLTIKMKLRHGERLSLQTKKANAPSLNIQTQIKSRHQDDSYYFHKPEQDELFPQYSLNKQVKNSIYKKLGKRKAFRNFDQETRQPQIMFNMQQSESQGVLKSKKPLHQLKQLPNIGSQASHKGYSEMMCDNFGKSQKIIKKNEKNTQLLNQIIDILKTEPHSQYNKRNSLKLKKIKTEQEKDESINQYEFVNIKPETYTRNGPKIANNQFLKLFSKTKNINVNRRIYSEERSRKKIGIEEFSDIKQPKKKTNKIQSLNDLGKNEVQLMTFYNPRTKGKLIASEEIYQHKLQFK